MRWRLIRGVCVCAQLVCLRAERETRGVFCLSGQSLHAIRVLRWVFLFVSGDNCIIDQTHTRLSKQHRGRAPHALTLIYYYMNTARFYLARLIGPRNAQTICTRDIFLIALIHVCVCAHACVIVSEQMLINCQRRAMPSRTVYTQTLVLHISAKDTT